MDIENHEPIEAEIQEALKSLAKRMVKEEKMKKYITEKFSEAEKNGKVIDEVKDSAETIEIMKEYLFDTFDQETNLVDIRDGIRGYLWGSTVWVDNSIPEGEIKIESSSAN